MYVKVSWEKSVWNGDTRPKSYEVEFKYNLDTCVENDDRSICWKKSDKCDMGSTSIYQHRTLPQVLYCKVPMSFFTDSTSADGLGLSWDD